MRHLGSGMAANGGPGNGRILSSPAADRHPGACDTRVECPHLRSPSTHTPGAPWLAALAATGFDPACAAVVTSAGGAAALWTACSPESTDFAVIAVANRGPAGEWEIPIVLDAVPFPRALASSCGLGAVADRGDGAVAAWTNGGEVRFSRLR